MALWIYFKKLSQTKRAIIALGICSAMFLGALSVGVRAWTARVRKADQIALLEATTKHVAANGILQGRINQLQANLAIQQEDLLAAQKRASAAGAKPMPPKPIALAVDDPCADKVAAVEVVYVEREAVLQDVVTTQKDVAVKAVLVAETLTTQNGVLGAANMELNLAYTGQVKFTESIKLDLAAAQSSAHTWKVGFVTVSAAGLVYLLIKR